MNIVRWDPFRGLLGLHDQVRPSLLDPGMSAWVPAVDIHEKVDSIVIRAEIPGVDRNDIDVNIEDGMLVLSGERKREAEFTEENACRLERTYGSFSRRFSLPKTVDASKVDATYENGVLVVTLPKAEEAKSRKIKIKAA